ncbi:MAG: hypothetical protein U0T83_05195 [Bacteriovoracaceae bacterium]
MVKKISPSNITKPIFIGGILAFTFLSQNLIKTIAVNYSEKTKITIKLPNFNLDNNENNLVVINPSQNNNDELAINNIKREILLVQAKLNKKDVVVKKKNKKVIYKTIVNRTVIPEPPKMNNHVSYEINNKEFIVEKRVTIQINEIDYKVAWARNFEKMSSQIFANLNKMEKIENTVSVQSKPIEKITEDKVEQAVSGLDKKEVQEEKEPEIVNVELDKDLEVFDYSKKPVTVESKSELISKPQILSTTVMNVIHREKENINNLTTQKPKISFNFRDSQNVASVNSSRVVPSNQTSGANEYPTQNSYKTNIKTFELSFEKGEGDYLTNFNFRPNYQEADVVSDSFDGILSIENKLSNENSILSGTITKQEYMPLKVDLVLEQEDTDYNIPLISESEFNNYIEENNLSGKGGNVLLKLEGEIKSVEFDKKYEKKIFLNRNFTSVDDLKDADYILFFGINSGNALMELTNINGKVLSKVINLEEEKINFDIINIESVNQTIVSLKENRVLSDKVKELTIDEDKITLFNTNIKGKSTGALSNRYEFLDYYKFVGEREYFEFGHMNETIFVGKNKDVEVIELPNEEYVDQIFKNLNLVNLENQCLTQINLSKKIKQAQIELTSQKGPAPLNISYYDIDGTFNGDITDETSKIYITGDEQGAINMKLEYVDGTVDYLRTYCSIGSFVIEQN